MKKGKYLAAPRRKKKTAVILLAAAALLLAAVSVLLVGRQGGQQVKLPNGETVPQSDSVEKRTDSIAIPGYEGISLKANSKEQEIGFPNPAQNTCYFQISLMLEDGTLLWHSELVAPGEISNPITLEEPLEAGVYPNALLKFDCYTMDGAMRALNGAATKMTLHVK
mgnify:CR=1 FL=1